MIHYETKSWLRVLSRFHGSVVPRIAGRCVAVAAIGAAVAYLHLEQRWDLPIASSLHAMVGVALGLLLVFRTNASYDRYWEGRKLLGGMVNNSRDLARQTAAYLGEADPAVRARACTLIVALFATIRHYLRNERDLSDLDGLVTADQRVELETTGAPPLLVATWLTELYAGEHAAGRLTPHQLALFDDTLADMIDLWGGAERIMKTPVPFAYAHHIKGFLTIFCFSSPLGLLSALGWYTPLAAAIVAYGLYGIDEIGVEIEDPFGYDPNDLDLDGMNATIARNVGDLLES